MLWVCMNTSNELFIQTWIVILFENNVRLARQKARTLKCKKELIKAGKIKKR